MEDRKLKRSLRQRIQDFMATPKGQTVMNYAYNWGAAIVILGTLFKLTHLPGANQMLFIGMGTEVLIFFISAFDLTGVRSEPAVSDPVLQGQGTVISGTVVLSPGVAGTTVPGTTVSDVAAQQGATVVTPTVIMPTGSFTPTTIASSTSVIGAPPATISPEMETATAAYLEQLKAMTAMLSRCTTQAENLSQDTEQMNLLNRNLSGINAIYEMQLRSVSTQIGTIDQVHEQTRKMARQIEELNEVYARMLQAMTVK